MSALTVVGLLLGIQAQILVKEKKWKQLGLTLLIFTFLLVGIYTDWERI